MTSRVFTGLKPTGQLQIGNYLGAIRPLMDLAACPFTGLADGPLGWVGALGDTPGLLA